MKCLSVKVEKDILEWELFRLGELRWVHLSLGYLLLMLVCSGTLGTSSRFFPVDTEHVTKYWYG